VCPCDSASPSDETGNRAIEAATYALQTIVGCAGTVNSFNELRLNELDPLGIPASASAVIRPSSSLV
jgi:hypothetical protein